MLRAFFAKELRGRLLHVEVIQREGEESAEIGLGPWAVRMGEGTGVFLGLALAALLWLGFGLAIAFLEAEMFDLLLNGLFALVVFQLRTRGEALVVAIGLPVLPVAALVAVDLIGGFGGTIRTGFPIPTRGCLWESLYPATPSGRHAPSCFLPLFHWRIPRPPTVKKAPGFSGQPLSWERQSPEWAIHLTQVPLHVV